MTDVDPVDGPEPSPKGQDRPAYPELWDMDDAVRFLVGTLPDDSDTADDLTPTEYVIRQLGRMHSRRSIQVRQTALAEAVRYCSHMHAQPGADEVTRYAMAWEGFLTRGLDLDTLDDHSPPF